MNSFLSKYNNQTENVCANTVCPGRQYKLSTHRIQHLIFYRKVTNLDAQILEYVLTNRQGTKTHGHESYKSAGFFD